jgi:hypothetical protein
MFIKSIKPKDYACGYNVELMIQAVPRLASVEQRVAYVNRIVGLIKQSHVNWVQSNGDSSQAWEQFFQMADYDPRKYGIVNPFDVGLPDLAK